MKHFIFILFFILIHQNLCAYTIQKLGIEQGLSNSSVVGVTQDKQGVMWIATKSGLNRFDGIEFKVFRNENDDDLRNNELNALLYDQSNNSIWLTTERKGLIQFSCNTNTFKYYLNNPKDSYSISNNGITDIKADSKGNLWLATYPAGVDYFDKRTQKFTHFNQYNVKGLGSNYNWCICDDNQGNLYIGHVQGGMSVLNVKKRTAKHYRHNQMYPYSIPNDNVNCIYIDSNKNVWVGTDGGLSLFNPKTGKFFIFQNDPKKNYSISSNFITCIDEPIKNKLFIGTINNGLNTLDLNQFYFDSNSEKIRFEHFGETNYNLSHKYIRSIYRDSYNNIWVGTFGGGLNFLSQKEPYFKSIKHDPVIGNKNSLSHRIVFGLCIDNNNSLWVATDGGGIDVYNNNEKVNNYSRINGKFVDNNVMSNFTDSEGNLWFGTLSGNIVRYKIKSKSFEQLSCFNSKGIQVHCFYEDKNRNIWIGSDKGLFVFNLSTGESKSYYTTNSELQDDVIRSITQSVNGNIWIGTLGGGIGIFDNNFKCLKILNPENSLYGISQLYRDSKNNIWIAVRKNLYLAQKGNYNELKSFGLKQGLADNYINAIMEGEDGKIWFSTNSGISSIDPQSKIVRNYNQLDEIPLGNFKPGAVAKSKNGIIYFGSENGVCYFDSNSQLEAHKIPKTTITDFAVSKLENSYTAKFVNIPITNHIDLNHNQNTFTVSFNVLDYSYNNQIEFSYMLEGLENAWYNVKNTKQITFRNLPPGKYIFHVKSRYRNQEWSEQDTTLPIRIRPPFWLSWWAQTIYALIILSLIVYFFRFYKRRLQLENSLYLEKQNNLQQQELNTERLKFYTNITHELRTPLTLIIGPLEDLKNDVNLQGKFQGKILSIHKSAVRLLELINQILEFRKTETQNRKLCVQRADLARQIREITLKYEELNRNDNLVISCSIQEADYELMYDPEVITIILDNLISNAIKYTPTGEIRLSISQNTENGISYTEIKLSDSGYGIDNVYLNRIFERYYQVKGKHQVSGSGIGLSIVKNLVELHEAEISVESELQKGTTFCIRLLTNNTYPDAIHNEALAPKIDDNTTENRPIMLVVEDNADIRNYVIETFADSFDILTAENGHLGLELTLTKLPDIIISDLMMPVMDGIEFCKKVKEDIRTSHIPFVMLTAKDTIQDKTEGYTSGADSYITKPFSGSLLQSRVFNLLEARKRMASLFTSNNFSQKQNDIHSEINPLDNEFILKLTTYVEEHLEDEDINIANVADKVFMSHSTLYRKIKAITGLSTNEFIRKIRLKNAHKLLTTGKHSISEVKYMVGISSFSYFRKAFKDEFGITPMEYLKSLKDYKKSSD